MPPETSKHVPAVARPTVLCLSQLIQDASGLQTLSHRFAMLCLTASQSLCGDVASPLQLRKALNNLLSSYSSLRNAGSSRLVSCDPVLVQIMAGAFSAEIEDVLTCFEAMARATCTALSTEDAPKPNELAELVRFVSSELWGANAVILDAARLVAITSLKDDEDPEPNDIRPFGRGAGGYVTPRLTAQVEQENEIYGQIREGIDKQQFEPFFQPQVEGRSGKLVGLESLVRWNHPTRGTLVPFHFLDAAEDAGLLDQLDQYLMMRTFATLRSWLDQGVNIPQVSINLTGSRLLDIGLVDTLVFAADTAGVETSMIGLEILESVMIDDTSRLMLDNLAGLAGAGFKLELDDFGTGHASIANLRHLKVDRIKIDRSFVKDIHLYSDLSKITGAMIGLAHSLRIDALAEGVETPEERLVLNALGCDQFQGYGVSQPMAGADVPAWVKRTQNRKALPPRRA